MQARLRATALAPRTDSLSARWGSSSSTQGKLRGRLCTHTEETIAVGGKIREIERLRKIYGRGRWRKMKGVAIVRLPDGTASPAEVHWYESHGIGRKELKIERLLGKLR